MYYYTFDESLELAVRNSFCLKVYLQGQEKGEEEFVIFIQASDCIAKYLMRQKIHDVGQPFGGDLRLWGLFQRFVKNAKELS